VVLDAPCNLGLRPPGPGAEPGARRLAQALRSRNLLARIGAADAGAIEVPPYSPERDLETWFRNGPGLIAVSERLADRLPRLLSQHQFVLTLGGDCSILLGHMLGLRGLGRYGLLFIDAHDDFSPLRNLDEYRGWFAAAGMDLGVVTGHTPGGLSNLRGLKPYVREEDVALFGISREPEDSMYFDTELLDKTRMRWLSVDQVRRPGPEAAARQALAWLSEQPLDGIWVHLDVDVLDRADMPAVDSPNPDGLRFDQLATALRVFLADPRVVGMEVTIYDPDLDPDGTHGDRLADMLIAAFAT
jgi:arginase